MTIVYANRGYPYRDPYCVASILECIFFGDRIRVYERFKVFESFVLHRAIFNSALRHTVVVLNRTQHVTLRSIRGHSWVFVSVHTDLISPAASGFTENYSKRARRVLYYSAKTLYDFLKIIVRCTKIYHDISKNYSTATLRIVLQQHPVGYSRSFQDLTRLRDDSWQKEY